MFAATQAVDIRIVMTDEELSTLTGYRQASKQLAELHRQGFYRARLSRAGGKDY